MRHQIAKVLCQFINPDKPLRPQLRELVKDSGLLEDLEHDYKMMLEDFGPQDEDVKAYAATINHLKTRR